MKLFSSPLMPAANANRDTLKVHIKYVQSSIDSMGPALAIVTPAKDSVTTNSSSYTATLQCTDASGVLSVNGALGTTAFTGVRGSGNNWTITINGLTANLFNTIIFTATDSSLRSNKTYDTLHIKSIVTNGYAITFDKNDAAATGTMAAQTINSGDSSSLTANAFSKPGYSFAGWMTSATGTTVAYADQAIFTMGTTNVTLYAKWTAIPTYSLTYDGNTNTGGTAPATVTGIVTGTTVTAAAAGTLAKTNYTFAGWNTAANGSAAAYAAGASITITANITLHAQWTLNTYSLTVSNDGHGTTTPSGTSTVTYGVATGISALANSCYQFSSWTVTSGTASIVSSASSNTFVTLTSGPATIKANFIANSGITLVDNLPSTG